MDISPGTMLALYPIPDALTPEILSFIADSRCSIISPHADPDTYVARAPRVIARVRAVAPNVRVWSSWGCDGLTNAVLAHPGRVESSLIAGCRVSIETGSEAICYDAERASRLNPEAGRAFATLALKVHREHAPDLASMFTSYDRPDNFPEFPWREWLGPGGVQYFLPQVYIIPDDGTPQPAGTLLRRFAREQRAVSEAAQAGLIAPDVIVFPYLECKGVQASDLIAVGSQFPWSAFWRGAPHGLDAQGAYAISYLAAQKRGESYAAPAGASSSIVPVLGVLGTIAAGVAGWFLGKRKSV